MLERLSISNYALIDQLEMQPSSGLNIITGETGAGKSIMLGAVGLLLGNRADTRVLLDSGRKCVVEGEFDVTKYDLQPLFADADLDYESSAIIRREVSPTGKSRAFVNDTPVNLEVLRSVGQKLIDIHSQNDTLRLGSAEFQLNIIDQFAGNRSRLQNYTAAYTTYLEARKKFDQLREEEAAIRRESDYNIFLLEELQKADFQPQEQAQLEDEQQVLSNVEEIKSSLFQALDGLSRSEFSAITNLENVVQHFRQLSRYSKKFEPLSTRLESTLIELQDILREAEAVDGDTEHDPRRIAEVDERLGVLYNLLKKHGVSSADELTAIRSGLESKVETFHNLDTLILEAGSKLDLVQDQATKLAQELRKARQKAAPELSSMLESMLLGLGMPGARIQVDWGEMDLSEHGTDHITILFSANTGIKPAPLKQVASGGEFSRLMFCIKYILAEKTAMPTLVFDEIDTGVSGEIALQLGDLMRQMSNHHQVVSISHLPQIAAKADRHFFVYKALNDFENKAVSRIRLLKAGERVEEIAKMISGDQPTESAFQNARELMEN